MKKIIIAALLLMTTHAHAGMWELKNSDYVAGTGWICTYQLSGTNYQSTIISNGYCRPYIFQ